MPQISVIVPVYKVEPYICRCIDSILAQSFSEYELILIDDGSSDNCGAICEEFTMIDDRISVIHQKNAGVSAARNAGIQMITGKFVSFVDSDDYCKAIFLEHLLESIKKNDADLIQSGFITLDESGAIINEHRKRVGEWTLLSDADKINYLISNVLYKGIGWENWSALFKRNIIETNKIRYCEKCGNYAEDLGFMLEYVLCCERIVSIDEHDYCYVRRAGSTMAASRNQIKIDSKNEISYQFGKRFLTVIHGRKNQNRFAILHFLILRYQYSQLMHNNAYEEVVRELHVINNIRWHDKWIRKLIHHKKELAGIIGTSQASIAVLNSRLWYHKNWRFFKFETTLVLRFFVKVRNKIASISMILKH